MHIQTTGPFQPKYKILHFWSDDSVNETGNSILKIGPCTIKSCIPLLVLTRQFNWSCKCICYVYFVLTYWVRQLYCSIKTQQCLQIRLTVDIFVCLFASLSAVFILLYTNWWGISGISQCSKCVLTYLIDYATVCLFVCLFDLPYYSVRHLCYHLKMVLSILIDYVNVTVFITPSIDNLNLIYPFKTNFILYNIGQYVCLQRLFARKM